MKVKPKKQQRVTHGANRKQAASAIAGESEALAGEGTNNDWGLPPASLRSDLPWDLNLQGYPILGEPGIAHHTTLVPMDLRDRPRTTFLQCSILRDHHGRMVGKLNHYPLGMFNPAWANKGEVSMGVGEYCLVIRKSERNQGYGLALLEAADRRWSLDFWRQDYTVEGRALVVKYLNQRA